MAGVSEKSHPLGWAPKMVTFWKVQGYSQLVFCINTPFWQLLHRMFIPTLCSSMLMLGGYWLVKYTELAGQEQVRITGEGPGTEHVPGLLVWSLTSLCSSLAGFC